MRKAYLISAFKDPSHLGRLVSALDDGESDFFVHIDRKQAIQPYQEQCKGHNVVFLSNRVNVYWGTYSQVEFQMRLIHAALNAGNRYERLFILSGQDYPLWSNSRINDYLSQIGDEELLSGICLESEDVSEEYKKIYRLYRPQTDLPILGSKFNDRLSKGIRKVAKLAGIRKPLYFEVDGCEWQLYKGSDYLCLSDELARYVYHTWANTPAIRHYFKSSFAPSETCIQTIVFNHPDYRKRADLHQGDYTTLKDLTRLHHIDYVPVIRVWKEGDFDELTASGKMFARKFETGTSDLLLNQIDNQRNGND